MQSLKLTLLALAVCTLSACTKPATTSADTTTGIDDTRKLDVSKTKTMSASKSAKISETIPASRLVSQTLRSIVEIAGVDMPSYVQAVKFGGLAPVNTAAAMKPWGLEGGVVSDAAVARAAAEAAGLAEAAGDDVVRVAVAEKYLQCLQMVQSRDAAGAHACLEAHYTRVLAAAAILAQSWPQQTPGLAGGETVDSFTKEREFSKKALGAWVGNPPINQSSEK